jgi:hypothetical protein
MRLIDHGAIVIGLLFMIAGTIYLLEALDVFSIEPGLLWPALLIGAGIGVAFGGKPRPEENPNE